MPEPNVKEIVRQAQRDADSYTIRSDDAVWVYQQAKALAESEVWYLVSEVLHKRLKLRVHESYYPSAVEVSAIVKAALKDKPNA